MSRGLRTWVALAAMGVLLAAAPAFAASRKPQSDEPKKEPEAALPTGVPVGPLQIIVSIKNQRATLYGGNGKPLATTPVSTGVADHPTPTGVFSILQKRTWHESNIYSAAPMPFMQRITWSGVALHEGVVPGHPASHGCIRLPHEFANWLFAATDLGVRVVVANDELKVEDISHPFLFNAKPGQIADRGVRETGNILRDSAPASAARRVASVDADAGEEQDAMRINTASVFISRKEGRLFVRRNFAPLFDSPVRIEDRQRPLGTHVFTAMGLKKGGPEMRWTVISMKSADLGPELHDRYSVREHWVDGRPIRTTWFSRERWAPQTAAEVLDRIKIPREANERISELMTPGSSLIVSDEGLNKETRKHTDFVILTAPPTQFLNAEMEGLKKQEELEKRRPAGQERSSGSQPAIPPLPSRPDIDNGGVVSDRPQPLPALAPTPQPEPPAGRTRAEEPPSPVRPAAVVPMVPPNKQPAPQPSASTERVQEQKPVQPTALRDEEAAQALSRQAASHSIASLKKLAPTGDDADDAVRARAKSEAAGQKQNTRIDDDRPEPARTLPRMIKVEREPPSLPRRGRRNAEPDDDGPRSSGREKSASRERNIERAERPVQRANVERATRFDRASVGARRAGHQIDLVPP